MLVSLVSPKLFLSYELSRHRGEANRNFAMSKDTKRAVVMGYVTPSLFYLGTIPTLRLNIVIYGCFFVLVTILRY